MTPIVLGSGLAPDVSIVNGFVYVAYGQQTPPALVLVQLTLQGQEVSRRTLTDGFYNSWPRFGGAHLAYKRGAPTYGPALINVTDGEVLTYPGQADGNFGLAVNESLGIMAYQNGAYPIWFGEFSGGAGDSGLQGKADGLDTLVSRSEVTLRADTRQSVPGIYYPVHAGDLTVGEWIAGYGLGSQLSRDVLRVALEGQNCPVPRCATDGQVYALVTGGDAVRLLLGSRADLLALPPAVTPPQPPVVVPPIDKKCLLAWFSDETTSAPENCTLRVAFTSTEVRDNLIRDATAHPLAQYVASEVDPSQLEAVIATARAKHPTLPVVAYWPRSRWGTHCSADIYGVEAYQHVQESSAEFHLAVQTELAIHTRVWLVAQAYTTNAGNTPNTADVVPVIATLIRDNANTDGCLPFSAGSRPGGWNSLDNRTHQAWQDLYDSITGTPVVQPIDPPIPPQPPDLHEDQIMATSQVQGIIHYVSKKASGRAGCTNYTLKDGSVFSCQGDGTAGSRPAGTDGPWEQGQESGACATFNTGPAYYTWLVAPIDKLEA